MQDIVDVITLLARDNFDDESINLEEDTALTSIDDWDSMEQVNMIKLIEEQYEFKFNAEELTAMSTADTPGKMARIIEKK